MIKRTIYIGNPAYLSMRNKQLILKLLNDGEGLEKSIPVEDIGIFILDNPQITLTHSLLNYLLSNNVSVVTCNNSHMPEGLFLPLESNQVQSERFASQINGSKPLKKQLWRQTVSAKITNQGLLLKSHKKQYTNMMKWASKVLSGDSNNLEARAAAYYWKVLFSPELQFSRDRENPPPNNLLNYGYAILRAITARALVASGLLPTLGIHHHNKYNAFCLADDIMEPYRPFLDSIVVDIVNSGDDYSELTTALKKQLIGITSKTIVIDKVKSPLMVGIQRTTASLVKCFNGEVKKIIYPELIN